MGSAFAGFEEIQMYATLLLPIFLPVEGLILRYPKNNISKSVELIEVYQLTNSLAIAGKLVYVSIKTSKGTEIERN